MKNCHVVCKRILIFMFGFKTYLERTVICRILNSTLRIFVVYNSWIRETDRNRQRRLEKGASSLRPKKHELPAANSLKETTTLFFSCIPGVSFLPESRTRVYAMRCFMLLFATANLSSDAVKIFSTTYFKNTLISLAHS